MFVKPAPGKTVILPGGTRRRAVPAEGLDVPDTGPDATFWLRRIIDCDVVKVERPAVEKGEA